MDREKSAWVIFVVVSLNISFYNMKHSLADTGFFTPVLIFESKTKRKVNICWLWFHPFSPQHKHLVCHWCWYWLLISPEIFMEKLKKGILSRRELESVRDQVRGSMICLKPLLPYSEIEVVIVCFCGCNPGDLSPPSPDRDHPGQLSHRRLRFLQHLSALVCIKFIPSANVHRCWAYCMFLYLIHSNLTWTIFPSRLLSAALIMSMCNVTVVFHVFRSSTMGKGCVTVSKYFLFLFNVIFFVSI